MARFDNPQLIPEKVSPHVFRHSRAMHLLQSGVQLSLIHIWKSTVRTVYALPKFTIPDDKLLLVELYEKNGGRPVSYTHLDVYKRQRLLNEQAELLRKEADKLGKP